MPNILIVDDDQLLTEALCEYLRQETDWSVRTASSGDEAWKLFKWSRFDAVTTDAVNPGMGGLEFCLLSKKLRPETNVIIHSGWATAEEAKEVGADWHFKKPFRLVDYLMILKRLLGLQF
jgi:DNA-binding response OmpR family regulator